MGWRKENIRIIKQCGMKKSRRDTSRSMDIDVSPTAYDLLFSSAMVLLPLRLEDRERERAGGQCEEALGMRDVRAKNGGNVCISFSALKQICKE